ncbi:hypothetical protein [Leptospira kanakyensis]|uniref:hypothetical protein n=1 Tax=Leptospira kanakyensis TaxID=2484968 RepID=UPI00223C8E37|nr:hypothetical protein [Leptospira kanakyensis]MCW7470818.1 hypothetical protein [Leptospira kanakyensis]
MDFAILNNGIQIEAGGVSFAFIAIKILLLLVGSIFVLFSLPGLPGKKPVEDPTFNHPFIMFVSGIFWFTVGLLTPLGTDKTSIFLDGVSKEVSITKESTNFKIPFSEFQFLILLPNSAFVAEEDDTQSKSDSETKHISLITSYGFELELGSLDSMSQNQKLNALVTLMNLPIIRSISEIPKKIRSEPSKLSEFNLSSSGRKIQFEWDWMPVPSFLYLLGSGIIFLYGICLVYYFLRLAPAKKFPSFSQLLWGIVFIFFSSFILYISLIYGWGRNQVWIGEESFKREFSLFGISISSQVVPKKSLGSLYLNYPIGKEDHCLLYLLYQSEKYQTQWERIYETKWESIYRFDEPNLFFKMKVCDLTVENRLRLMKDIYQFSLTDSSDTGSSPSEIGKEKESNSY